MLIRIPTADDEVMYVNPDHVVALVPTEKDDYCYLTLSNDEEGYLVAMGIEELAEFLMSGGTNG